MKQLSDVPIPHYWTEALKNEFSVELEKVEEAMKQHMLDQIKRFPKPQIGYIRNRLEIRLEPIIIIRKEKKGV